MVHENKKHRHDDKNQGNTSPSPLRLTTGKTRTNDKNQIYRTELSTRRVTYKTTAETS